MGVYSASINPARPAVATASTRVRTPGLAQVFSRSRRIDPSSATYANLTDPGDAVVITGCCALMLPASLGCLLPRTKGLDA